MKVEFFRPPSGPGISGCESIPGFGSENCPSRTRFETYEIEVKADDWKTAEDGRLYFVSPVSGFRVYARQPKQTVKFAVIPKP
jgi:hypothetical protein